MCNSTALALKNLRCPLAKLDECFEDNANKAIPLVAKGKLFHST